MTILAILGCGKVAEPPKPSSQPLMTAHQKFTDLSPEDFMGKKISQFLLVIFKKSLMAKEWTQVFLDTQELSTLKSQISALNRSLLATGVRSEEDQQKYISALMRSGEILVQLYQNSAVYLVSWTDNDECAFDSELAPILKCGLDESNSLNGGMPVMSKGLAIKKMGTDYLPSAVFSMALERAEYGKFELELRLKHEFYQGEHFFAGDVKVAPGSTFVKEGEAIPAFEVGYAEMRF